MGSGATYMCQAGAPITVVAPSYLTVTVGAKVLHNGDAVLTPDGQTVFKAPCYGYSRAYTYQIWGTDNKKFTTSGTQAKETNTTTSSNPSTLGLTPTVTAGTAEGLFYDVQANCTLASPGPPSATDTTLAVELDKFVRNNPRYQWKQLENMIDVFPTTEGSSVFDVTIDYFEANDAIPIQMVQELIQHPAVALYLSKRKTAASTWLTGSTPLERSSVKIEKLSLREALNEVVLSTNRLGWIAFHLNQGKTDTLWFQLW